MNLSDFQRRALLSSAGKSAAAGPEEPTPYSHAAEQARLREETLNAFGGAVSDEDEGEVFVKKGGADDVDEPLEDEEYRSYLLGHAGGDAGVREALFGTGETAAPDSVADVEAEGSQKKKSKKDKKAKAAEGASEIDPEIRKKEEEEFLLECVVTLPRLACSPILTDHLHLSPQLHPQPRLDRPRGCCRPILCFACRLQVQVGSQGGRKSQGRRSCALGRRGRRR